MRTLVTVIAIAALCAAGCGKSEQQQQAEKAAEDLKKAAEGMAKAAEQVGTAAAAQGATDMAKALQGAAAALSAKTPDGKPIEPMTFQALETALPDLSGWKMAKPEGERMTSPIPFSKTETDYQNGEERVEVSITDTAAAMMLLMPVRMMVATGYSRETSNGYEKAVSVNGMPAVEKWSSANKDGELTVLVNDRFIVQFDGRNVSGVKTLHDFAAKTDFGKLK
jgi:hypothetical protein